MPKFTEVAIDLKANKVDVYSVPCAGSTIAKALLGLFAPHTYRFHASIATKAEMDAAQRAVAAQLPSLAKRGIRVSEIDRTLSGKINVGFSSANDKTAWASISRLVPAGRATWHHQAPHRSTQLAWYRYQDAAAWYGGDGLTNSALTAACSSSVPIKVNGTSYVLTAAHCGSTLYNNMIKTYKIGGSWQDPANWLRTSGSGYEGPVAWSDPMGQQPYSATSDTEIINARSGGYVFTGSPFSTTYVHQVGIGGETIGKSVCTSGAFSGEICNILISSIGNFYCEGAYSCVTVTWGQRSDGAAAAGHGDSGGPVYSYSGSSVYAQGMINVGYPGTEATCPNYSYWGDSPRVCYKKMGWISMATIQARWSSLRGFTITANS